MANKYKLLRNDFIYKTIANDKTVKLYRIEALRDFDTTVSVVHKGDLGGYVQAQKNLSQFGSSWIGSDVKVWGNAFVRDNALVVGSVNIFDSAGVCGSSYLNSRFFSELLDSAEISGRSEITVRNLRLSGNSSLNNAHVSVEELTLAGNVDVRASDPSKPVSITSDTLSSVSVFLTGNMEFIDTSITGEWSIAGDARFYNSNLEVEDGHEEREILIPQTGNGVPMFDRADLRGSEDLFSIVGIGSEGGVFLAYRAIADNGKPEIQAVRGCFRGSLKQFCAASKQRREGDMKYDRQYATVATLARQRICLKPRAGEAKSTKRS